MTNTPSPETGPAPDHTIAVTRSNSRDAAAAAFLTDLRDWADTCIAEYRDAPATDVHDQNTYTLSFLPLIRATGYVPALDLMRTSRDRIRDHFEQTGQWRHGYWKRQEVHHGTEHFELFMHALWQAAPDDGETIAQFIDAAEHLGNWADDVPDWYDYDADTFHSLYFGTDFVDPREATRLNVADHFRCINLLLIAHEMTADVKYLDLASRYARRWANAIVEHGQAPVGLNAQGPISRLEGDRLDAYRAFAGQSGDLSVKVDRAENLLASDGINALLTLWQRAGDKVFRDAAAILVGQLATELQDPDAGPAADAVRRYRRVTGDSRFDQALLDAVAHWQPDRIQYLGIRLQHKTPTRAQGIGKRADAPAWLENSKPRQGNPITLACAADITNDDKSMTCALDLGRAYFNLARRIFPHGRAHGCAARSVSAIARGHGRDNNVGMVTAILAQAI